MNGLGLAGRLAEPRGVERLRDLGEQRANQVVAEHERVRFGEPVPEPGPDILERLDAWFEPHQERYAAYRHEQDKKLDRHARASAELDRQLAAQNEARWRGVWGLPA